MNAEDRIIPIVEDDQGEGFKDPLSPEDLQEGLNELRAKQLKILYDSINKKHSAIKK